MFISLSTHIFVYHEFRDEFIDIIASMGFKSIELFAVYPHFPYRDDKSVGHLLDLCQKRGITLTSVHFPLYLHIDDIRKNRWLSLSSKDEEVRLTSVHETILASKALRHIEGGILVVHTSFPGGELPKKKAFLFIDSMKRIIDGIPEGVKVAIENTTGTTGTAAAISSLAESFSGERVGLCIDVGHANVVESPASALAIAGEKLINVHISDNDGEKDEHLPPGKGSIRWKRVARTLKEMDYRGPLTLEIRDESRGANKPELYLKELILQSRESFISFLG